MLEVAILDLEEYHQNKPMLHKQRLLPQAVEVMEKFHFADAFVTFGGCKALAMWLKNLPNGELPSVHIRTALLKCMERLPITKDVLQNCGEEAPLGRVVAGLQNNVKETVSNRKKAAQLVQKWLRQIFAPEVEGDSLADFLAGEADERHGTVPRPAPLTDESLKKIEEESDRRMHPAIPIIQGTAYAIQPKATDQPVRREKLAEGSFQGKLGEKLKVMSRPNKQLYKPWGVSIAGRQLNTE